MNRSKVNDFKKYSISRGIPTSVINRQFESMSPTVIDDSMDGFTMDIYTRLLNDRIIFLNTEIESYSSELVKAQMLYLSQVDSESDIFMYINSPGGSVYDGFGIIDTMDFIKPDVVTINTGLAASMAAVILCYGTKGKRKSLKRSRTMIHQPLGGSYGYSQASDIEIDAKEIIFLKKELCKIISECSGKEYEKVISDCDRDYWMDSTSAKEYGIIDEIIKSKK